MTISYNQLGSNGRLGNQMFQYAGLRGIASHRGFDWLIPRPESYGDSNYGLFDCFEMSSDYFIENASKDFQIKVEEEVRKCHTNFVLYGTKIKID